MNLTDFILFRKKLQNIDKTAYGFKGLYEVNKEEDSELIKKFKDSQIREVYNKDDNSTVNTKELKVGDRVVFSIDLSIFKNYYETFEDFVSSNRYSLISEDFYILELDYLHKISPLNFKITNFLKLQELITFLRNLSSHKKQSKGNLELFFHKPDKVCSINLNYDIEDVKNLNIIKPIKEIENHVFEKSDQETRRKLFTNEMINILSTDGYSFKILLKKWNSIETSYRSSFQIYLSEFSFEKIKTSSQEYFHELTDRIYSIINKFSGYILAIPVAYIFIIRFFDFGGNSFAKDTFLVVFGVLYFLIIWFVLINNLKKAFNTIKNDIERFLKRIKDEENLSEITDSLETQKNKTIPNQKRKIWLVRIISIIVLLMTVCAYMHIYYKKIKLYFESC